MEKHTPGPWKATKNTAYWQIDSERDGQIGDACISQFIEGNTDGGEANAKLMAAAPELLESLEKLVRELHESIYTRAANTWATPEVAYEYANQLTQSYRDLIAKAKCEA